MRVAVFDIGTNSIHMLVVEVHTDGTFRILEHEKDTTRLGDGSFKTKQLSPSAMRRGINAIARFQQVARKLKARKTIAVATSAVREAQNGGLFIRKVYQRTRIYIRVISGEEEARLIFLAAKSGLHTSRRKALVIDIGGGSVELIVGDQKKIYLLESLKLGVARLTDRFITKDPVSKKNVRSLVSYVEKKLKKTGKKIRKLKVSRVIGTAGTFISLGALVHEAMHAAPLKTVSGFAIHREELDDVAAKVLKRPWNERLKMPGMDPRRIDIVVAGALLVRTIMRTLKIRSVVLSKRGIREGIVLDYIAKNRIK